MRLKATLWLCLIFLFSKHALAGDYLVQIIPQSPKGLSSLSLKKNMVSEVKTLFSSASVKELPLDGWSQVTLPEEASNVGDLRALKALPGVVRIQPNYKIYALGQGRGFGEKQKPDPFPLPFPLPEDDRLDNPDFVTPSPADRGADPLTENQWGLDNVRGERAKNRVRRRRLKEIVVAVIDTGVDYTHEDLVNQMWWNKGEQGVDQNGNDKATNGIDDDGNGYIDDVMGWDFVSNDNKPYDLLGNLFLNGNAGHGTHCAGTIAAEANNGKGITGVASNVKIMPLRFFR